MKITRISPVTGKENTLDLPITEAQIELWQGGGEYIQDVFPDLSPDQREFLLTGMTPEDWADTFGSEEDCV